MSLSNVPVSHTSESEPKALSTPSSDGKGLLGLGNVVTLDNWQSYIYLGAMFILTVQAGRKFFQGEFTGGLINSGLLATTAMGKINTDYAWAQATLGLIARSMETHVGHLEHEVNTFTTQLEENQHHISRLGHENEVFYKGNVEYREQISEMRQVLEKYSDNLNRLVEEETQTLIELRAEIRLGNEEKDQLRQVLAERQQALIETEQKLKQTTEHLLQLAEKAANAPDSEALKRLIEGARTPSNCRSPHYTPLRKPTEVH